MNTGDTGMLLLRLPAATAANGRATRATEIPVTVIGEFANRAEAETAAVQAEAGLFAGILEVLAQAGDTLIASGSRETPSQLSLVDAPEAVLDLVREAGIDLDAVAGPFSLVQFPVLKQADDPARQSALLPQLPDPSAAISRSQLLLATEADVGQTARALTHMRTLQGIETATASTVPVVADHDGSAMLPPGLSTAAAGQLSPASVPLSATGAEAPLRPGQAEWPTTFAARVVWLVEGGRERADLRLEPPHLGQLAVRVRLDGDQASLSFHSQHGMVREVVENALPRLRELMAEAGYTLAEVDIGSGDGHAGGDGARAGTADRGAEPAGDGESDEQAGGQATALTGDRLFDAYA